MKSIGSVRFNPTPAGGNNRLIQWQKTVGDFFCAPESAPRVKTQIEDKSTSALFAAGLDSLVELGGCVLHKVGDSDIGNFFALVEDIVPGVIRQAAIAEDRCDFNFGADDGYVKFFGASGPLDSQDDGGVLFASNSSDGSIDSDAFGSFSIDANNQIPGLESSPKGRSACQRRGNFELFGFIYADLYADSGEASGGGSGKPLLLVGPNHLGVVIERL